MSSLLHAHTQVARRTGLTATAARAAKTAAAVALFPFAAVTALDLLDPTGPHATARLTTGCAVMDAALRGGVRARGITEIVGESASAKTQLCLQLAITVQLPPKNGGLAGGAVYICTEDAFPNKRMAQLAEVCGERWAALAGVRVSDRVFVEHCGTVAGLLGLLAHKVVGRCMSSELALARALTFLRRMHTSSFHSPTS